MTIVYDLLSQLGIGRRYLGRNYLAYGIEITMRDENYFFLVTKNLYPDVAKHFGADWRTVERDMRTAIHAAWEKNRQQLEELAGYPLERPPKAVDFIDYIVTYLKRKEAHKATARPP